MDFEKYYARFEKEAMKRLGTALWDKAARLQDPRDYVESELLVWPGLYSDPRKGARRYAEYVKELEGEGVFSEANSKLDKETIMDFEEYYQKFEAEAKKLLSAELWDKAVVDIEYPTGEWDKSTEIRNRAIDFAKELFDSDAFNDDPEGAAEEFAEMVQEMDKEGAFDEGKCEDGHECKWHVEYELIDGDKEDETFDDETEAWSRFNELDARTKGGLADVLWVKEPACPTCECGSSAASLGAVPNGGSQAKDEGRDEFLKGALHYMTLGDDETIIVKLVKDGEDFKLIALMPDDEAKTVLSSNLFSVVDYYRDLADMPDAEAITLIEEA